MLKFTGTDRSLYERLTEYYGYHSRPKQYGYMTSKWSGRSSSDADLVKITQKVIPGTDLR